jgi:hypothetical protein
MTTKDGNVAQAWRAARRCVWALPALSSAYAGTPTPPVSCNVPPQVAAVSFFEFIESPRGEENLRKAGEAVLSRRLLQTSTPSEVFGLVRAAKEQYSFDRFEVPLSARLAGEPQMLDRGQHGWNSRADVSVQIHAVSSRGRVEQRVSLACEDAVWKTVSFSYGPPGK